MEISNESTGPTLFDPTLYAEATPASLSAYPANVAAKKTRATSGHGYDKPYAFYDPVTQSLKMYEAICPLAGLPSLAKLPPSGILQNGVLFLRPPWEPITAATESLSWPTPTALVRPMEGNVRLYRAKIEAGEMTEEEAAAILGKSPFEAQGKIPAMWPTPTTQEVEHPDATLNEKGRRVSKDGKNSHSLGLADAVQKWPTPRAGSMYGGTGSGQIIEERYTEGTISAEERQSMRSGNGGKLNPTWVEWLMGFPLGWTDLKDSETQ